MTTTRRIALVTAARALGLDEDLPLLQRALGELGIAAEIVVWDDAAVEWQRFDAAVVRSTWDYFSRRDGVPRLGGSRGRGDSAAQPAAGAAVEHRQAVSRRAGERRRADRADDVRRRRRCRGAAGARRLHRQAGGVGGLQRHGALPLGRRARRGARARRAARRRRACRDGAAVPAQRRRARGDGARLLRGALQPRHPQGRDLRCRPGDGRRLVRSREHPASHALRRRAAHRRGRRSQPCPPSSPPRRRSSTPASTSCCSRTARRRCSSSSSASPRSSCPTPPAPPSASPPPSRAGSRAEAFPYS